jgi:hypothetical protein
MKHIASPDRYEKASQSDSFFFSQAFLKVSITKGVS